jgi:hypothetical protein
MMHQPIDAAPRPDPHVALPRDPPPTLTEAAKLLTEPRVLEELAYHARNLRARDELAAALEQEAVRCDRASDGFADRHRYDLAAGQRERARLLRRWAAALRVVHCATVTITPT